MKRKVTTKLPTQVIERAERARASVVKKPMRAELETNKSAKGTRAVSPASGRDVRAKVVAALKKLHPMD